MTFFKERSFTYYKKYLLSYVIALLIPIVIIGTINFYMIREQYFFSLEKSIYSELNDKVAFLNDQLQTMNSIVYNCKREKIYNTHYQGNPIETYFDIMNDLKDKEVSVAMFSRIYYYNSIDNYIVSADGKYDMTYFFSKRMSMDTWESFNFENIKHNNFTAIKTKIVDENQYSVIILTPLENDYSSGKGPVSFLMFEITDSELKDLILSSEIASDFYGVLYFNGVPIYSNNNLYNDLIFNGTDIEKHIESNNGSKMYHYSGGSLFDIKVLVPKLLYDQIVYKLVFIQAILMLLVLGLGYWVIFYFMQRNYRPIKHIIQNVSGQYHQGEELADEFKYIDFVIKDLLYAKELLEESNHDLKAEKYLYNILGDQVQKDSPLYDECLKAGIRADSNYFSCIIMDQVTDNQKICSTLNQQFSRQPFAINYYFSHLAGEKYLYLLCSDEDLSELLDCLNDIFKSAELCDIRVGIGKPAVNISKVNSSYLSAQTLLLGSSEDKEDGLTSGTIKQQTQVYPRIEIEALREAVITNNTDKIEFAFNNIKKVISNNNMAVVNIAICTDIAKIFTASGEGENYENIILQMDSLDPEAILQSLEKIYHLYIKENHATNESVNNKSYKNIGEIVKYIKENYQNNFFTIKYMAMEFGTTSSNLSHYFKKSTGKNISQYIDELRIQRAKELLEDNELKISEIAVELGYNNTSVLIETFKKYEGMTPGMYRAYKNKDIDK